MPNLNPQIAGAVARYLASTGNRPIVDGDRGIFTFIRYADGALWYLKYCIEIQADGFTLHVPSPLGTHPWDRAQIASLRRFFDRINPELETGGFECDEILGFTRYTCIVPWAGALPSDALMGVILDAPALAFERYGRRIIDIIHNHASPDACADAET